MRVEPGTKVSFIVPATFASIDESGLSTVTLRSTETDEQYAQAIQVEWNEAISRHVVTVDTVGLPPGVYELKIPLGTGEMVTLRMEVGDGE